MNGGTTTQASQSNSVNQIPQWMTNAGQQNYAFAQQVAEQPLQQYQGQMVSSVAPQTQQSWDVAANSGNVGSDQYNLSTAGYLGALAQNPSSVSAGGPTMQVNNPGNAAAITAGQIGNTNLDPYMNPYTKDVINATLPGLQQANALSQNQQANAANSSNAFGGSRQGIQQGVAQAQGAMNIGQMLASLNSANFSQAQAAATGDINRNLTAATQNQNSQQQDLARQNTDLLANQSANAADLNRSLQAQTTNQGAQQAKINSDIAASQGLSNTGDSMSKNNVANYNMLSSAGASQSMQQQNEINAQMAKFNQAFNYPQQQLGTLLSALGMTPHDTSTSGSSTSQTTTPTDWASIIQKGAGAAADIYGMSDKTMKTDITKLGKDPETGLTMHAFRYKGDPKSYPKVVGPMAQDVEKQYPGSTKKFGGKMAIPLGGQHIPTPKGYAGGTPFVQPALTPFLPPSSPLVAKGLGALSAFQRPVKLPRGATTAPMPKHFAFGTSSVPDMDDAALGDSIQGGGLLSRDDMAAKLKKLAGDAGGDPAQSAAAPAQQQAPQGWNAPSMGYFKSGFAGGTPMAPNFGSAPGPTDTVPAMLTPGEAVLTGPAADHLGRHNIAKLNAFLPPVGSGSGTTAMRAGARGMKGALANTKLRPKMAGGLSG